MRQQFPQGKVNEHQLTEYFMNQAVPDGYVWCGNMRAGYLINTDDSQTEGLVCDPLATLKATKFGKAPFFGVPKGRETVTEEDIELSCQVSGNGGLDNWIASEDFASVTELIKDNMVGMYRPKSELTP